MEKVVWEKKRKSKLMRNKKRTRSNQKQTAGVEGSRPFLRDGGKEGRGGGGKKILTTTQLAHFDLSNQRKRVIDA